MRRIDKLLFQAQQMAGLIGQKLSLALVVPDGDRWTVRCDLWDGIEGHAGRTEEAVFDTLDEAVDHAHEVEARYAPSGATTLVLSRKSPEDTSPPIIVVDV